MKCYFKQCILFYGGHKIFTSSSKNQPSILKYRRKERIEAEMKEDVKLHNYWYIALILMENVFKKNTPIYC